MMDHFAFLGICTSQFGDLINVDGVIETSSPYIFQTFFHLRYSLYS